MNNEIQSRDGKTLYLIGTMIAVINCDFEHVYAENASAEIGNDGHYFYAYNGSGQWCMFSRCDWKFKPVS